MAIFSTRSSKRDADEAPSRNVPIDSIETLRTRARQRLIGAVVLVALGIIGFTLLFDSQPRPIPVDIQITMPDKDKPDATVSTTVTAPAAAVVEAPASASSAAPAVAATAAAAAVQASASLSAKEEIVATKTDKKPEVKVEAKPEPKAEAKTETKPVVKAEPKPAAKPEVKPTPKPATDEAAKALAILEGKEPPKAAATANSASSADATVGRFVVQVGAFAENEKAREARLKVERAGLKTYVHVAETPQGKRIRVRAGPFATRAEAEKAAAKIKTLDLPAAILTL
ncbi:MAG: SPOR domain-containing protein [Burkholderiaceae bacterium]